MMGERENVDVARGSLGSYVSLRMVLRDSEGPHRSSQPRREHLQMVL